MEGAPTRFADLWDGFEPVSEKLNSGDRTLRELLLFLRGRAELEEAYSRGLKKLAESSIPSTSLPKGVSLLILNCMQNEVNVSGDLHQNCANQLNTLAADVINYTASFKRVKDRCYEKGSIMTRDLMTAKIGETKAKEKYHKLAAAHKNKKTDEANLDYTMKVGQLRSLQQKYYSDMPDILNEMQDADLAYSEKVTVTVGSYIALLETIVQKRKEAVDALSKRVDTFDVQAEIKQFILTNYNDEKPTLADYISFEETIQQGKSTDSGKSNSSRNLNAPAPTASPNPPESKPPGRPPAPNPKPGGLGAPSNDEESNRPTSPKPDNAPLSPRSEEGPAPVKLVGVGAKMVFPMGMPMDGSKKNTMPPPKRTGPPPPNTPLPSSPSPNPKQTQAPKQSGPPTQSPPVVPNKNTNPPMKTSSPANPANKMTGRPPVNNGSMSEPKGRVRPTRMSVLFSGQPNMSAITDTESDTPGKPARAEALYDWAAEDPGEISIQAKDILDIISEQEGGWFYGLNLRSKEKGRFPGNFVIII